MCTCTTESQARRVEDRVIQQFNLRIKEERRERQKVRSERVRGLKERTEIEKQGQGNKILQEREKEREREHERENT